MKNQRILLYVFPGLERIALLLARALADKLPGTQFAAVIVREDYPNEPTNYLRAHAGELIRPILSQSEMTAPVLEGRVHYEPAVVRRLEREYGDSPFWHFVQADRYLSFTRYGTLYRYGSERPPEELLAIVQNRFLSVERLFDEFSPTTVLFCDPDTSPGTAAIVDRVAHRRRVSMLVPHRTRVGHTTLLNDTIYSRFRHVEHRFEQIRSGVESQSREEAQRRLEEIRSGEGRYHPLLGDRSRSTRHDRLVKRFRSASIQARTMLREIVAPRASRDPVQIPLWDRFTTSLVRQTRRWRIAGGTPFEEARAGEQYVFFPLHHEPELSLLLFAPFHTHQLAIIQNLALSLPADTRLYVKEHPATIGRGARSLDYYERIRRCVNVRLVKGDTHSLIERSVGVATITGTAGLEAMLLGKPVVTLGDVYYDFLDQLIFHVSDPAQLPAAFRRFSCFEPQQDQLVDFLSALLDHSIALSINPTVWDAALASDGRDRRFQAYADFVVQHLDTEEPPGDQPAS